MTPTPNPQTVSKPKSTYVMFEALGFLASLAALVPGPGVNLTRYHGVFAPNQMGSEEFAFRLEAKAGG